VRALEAQGDADGAGFEAEQFGDQVTGRGFELVELPGPGQRFDLGDVEHEAAGLGPGQHLEGPHLADDSPADGKGGTKLAQVGAAF
jgi:hypothetical protein